MKLYRAMNKQEADETLKYNSLSWNSKFKWFGTFEFVTSRVQDGKFNNSKYSVDRHSRLLEIEFSDNSMQHLEKCGYKEYMLNVRKEPMVKIIGIREIILEES